MPDVSLNPCSTGITFLTKIYKDNKINKEKS